MVLLISVKRGGIGLAVFVVKEWTTHKILSNMRPKHDQRGFEWSIPYSQGHTTYFISRMARPRHVAGGSCKLKHRKRRCLCFAVPTKR